MPLTPLVPSREQLAKFINALFPKALNTNGYVSLRSFGERDSGLKPRIHAIKLNGSLEPLIEQAFEDAIKAANKDAPYVFCPPVATFSNAYGAKESDLAAGLVLSVEIDADPGKALDKLAAILGPPTVVVRSGGVTSEGEPKLHVYWRLAKPATSAEELATLKKARRLATTYVGADGSNVPLVHPIRWAGSIHLKNEPRLCEIAELDADREIDLSGACGVLELVQEEPKQIVVKPPGESATGGGWADYIATITSGADGLHEATVRLAAALSTSGMNPAAQLNMLQAMFPPLADERLRNRYNDIPRAVRSGWEKNGRKPIEEQPEVFEPYEQPAVSHDRLRLIPFDDIKLQTENRHAIKGLLPASGLVVIWGAPKSGKSFWTFDAVMHMALNRPYRGRRVRSGPVVYCAMEGASGYGARKEAFKRRRIASDHETPIPFYLIPAPLGLVKDYKLLIESIRDTLGEQKPVAIVLDTLNRSIGGSESDDRDMAAYIGAGDALWSVFDCVVIIVHHCGIAGTRPRGHTSLTGAADGQLKVERDTAGRVIVELEWMKDGKEGLKLISRLEEVVVGTDEDGEQITSCVILPADNEFADMEDRKNNLTKNQWLMFSILEGAGKEGLTISKWYEQSKEAGIGRGRRSDLYEIKKHLEISKLIISDGDIYKCVI